MDLACKTCAAVYACAGTYPCRWCASGLAPWIDGDPPEVIAAREARAAKAAAPPPKKAKTKVKAEVRVYRGCTRCKHPGHNARTCTSQGARA